MNNVTYEECNSIGELFFLITAEDLFFLISMRIQNYVHNVMSCWYPNVSFFIYIIFTYVDRFFISNTSFEYCHKKSRGWCKIFWIVVVTVTSYPFWKYYGPVTPPHHTNNIHEEESLVDFYFCVNRGCSSIMKASFQWFWTPFICTYKVNATCLP